MHVLFHGKVDINRVISKSKKMRPFSFEIWYESVACVDPVNCRNVAHTSLCFDHDQNVRSYAQVKGSSDLPRSSQVQRIHGIAGRYGRV